MAHQFLKGAHGAGKHDAARTHRFGDYHPKRFEPGLKIKRVAALQELLRERSLSYQTAKFNPRLQLN